MSESGGRDVDVNFRVLLKFLIRTRSTASCYGWGSAS
jgi:hypothetical protein